VSEEGFWDNPNLLATPPPLSRAGFAKAALNLLGKRHLKLIVNPGPVDPSAGPGSPRDPLRGVPGVDPVLRLALRPPAEVLDGARPKQ
jgi:hypothetical protein